MPNLKSFTFLDPGPTYKYTVFANVLSEARPIEDLSFLEQFITNEVELVTLLNRNLTTKAKSITIYNRNLP